MVNQNIVVTRDPRPAFNAWNNGGFACYFGNTFNPPFKLAADVTFVNKGVTFFQQTFSIKLCQTSGSSGTAG